VFPAWSALERFGLIKRGLFGRLTVRPQDVQMSLSQSMSAWRPIPVTQRVRQANQKRTLLQDLATTDRVGWFAVSLLIGGGWREANIRTGYPNQALG
jgi:hypothetical protein